MEPSQMSYNALPHLNAFLNGTCAILMLLGFYYIRHGNRTSHRNLMIGAFATSCLFLISYLLYHAGAGSVRFPHQGGVRYLYFSILISHSMLAAAAIPMILITLGKALGKKYERHRSVARWTLPVWLYVSLTGVVVYLMLYHF
jgi:uncharacterized membrane protein YozB (DUF420 family)